MSIAIVFSHARAEDRKKKGITNQLVRLAWAIEDREAIIADLQQALNKI
jgi:O-acetylhomoserine/O-acetylserine sulfhydrylase-like pyridoxal-dependent enzyme